MARRLIYIMLAAVLLTACQSDDNNPAPETDKTGQGMILFGASSRSNGGVTWKNGRVASRANENGELDVDSEIPADFGVFAFADGFNTTYVFKNQHCYAQGTQPNQFDWEYTQSAWPYTLDEQEKNSEQKEWWMMRYRFFAYSPWFESQHVSVTAENFSGFNAFTWDNIPGFDKRDFVLANKIITKDNRDGIMKTDSVIHFEMRHILSRIRFFFKMDQHYREIRKLRLDSLVVLTAGNVKTATFNFNNNLAWDETVHWSNEQIGSAEPVTLKSKDGTDYEIQTDYPTDGNGKIVPFNSVYVYPQENFNEIKVRFYFTVFDSKNVATRHADVTNKIEIKPAWTLKSGYYYDMKINIVPDYLYVLSDNDQDFDGWVIIKEDKNYDDEH